MKYSAIVGAPGFNRSSSTKSRDLQLNWVIFHRARPHATKRTSIVAESAAIAVQFSVISGMRASTARAMKIDVATVTITQSRQLRW